MNVYGLKSIVTGGCSENVDALFSMALRTGHNILKSLRTHKSLDGL